MQQKRRYSQEDFRDTFWKHCPHMTTLPENMPMYMYTDYLFLEEEGEHISLLSAFWSASFTIDAVAAVTSEVL